MSAYGHAKITVTFEVSLNQPWSEKETMEQLAKVVPRDCRSALLRALDGVTKVDGAVVRPTHLNVDHFAVSQTSDFPKAFRLHLRGTR